ncbi:hypothetical protein ABC383_20670 [Noviherbaspirillum sp. 1P10PC]|uniref:hypothetical protein n=1 Tax=Noviherbaspirillum sp. 1P10PC TaxID=3132292 RepID=UPI00399FA87F
MNLQNNELADDELDKVSAGDLVDDVFRVIGAVAYGTGIGAAVVSGIAELVSPGSGAKDMADFIYNGAPPK